jgi:elongation of very long chain fatty acids protein 4
MIVVKLLIVFCNTDSRVENWFLMSSPFPALFIVMVYFTAVRFGPILMKERQPFKLKWLLIAYNFGVTILNGWMAFEVKTFNYLIFF